MSLSGAFGGYLFVFYRLPNGDEQPSASAEL